MEESNINLLHYGYQNTTKFLDTMFLILTFFLSTPSRVTGHSKPLIHNIFYNKLMLNMTLGNISSVMLSHLIQSLIEQSSTHAKHQHTCKFQRCYINFDQINWKKQCSDPDSNATFKHFPQIIKSYWINTLHRR